jgi:DNA-binding SARP family transcriptional activator
MTGTVADELSGEAFLAVFEQAGSSVDTIRAVVPSERQVRAYLGQLLASWSARLASNPKADLMTRRYAATITNSVSSDSSYVGDRLSAMLRLPAAERQAVTVIGEPLDHHAILVGAVRFGSTGPLYQLFPIALVRALVALIEGRPMPPQPPSPLPPADSTIDAGSEPEGAAEPQSLPAASNGHVLRLDIRTLGGLRITAAGEDLTSALLDRKVLSFLWLHLLARTLRNPTDSITRSSLADELSPGLDGSAQRSRLRGRLSELRNELPAALGRRVKVERERISLDLADCTIDVRELEDAGRKYGSSNGILTSEQLAQLDAVLKGVQGIFLTEWDDIELHVNSGRSGAGEVVNDLRKATDSAIAALLRTLGAGYLAHGNAEGAIAPLERALAITPDDEGAARSLSAACVQTGRLSRAEELRKEFSLV